MIYGNEWQWSWFDGQCRRGECVVTKKPPLTLGRGSISEDSQWKGLLMYTKGDIPDKTEHKNISGCWEKCSPNRRLKIDGLGLFIAIFHNAHRKYTARALQYFGSVPRQCRSWWAKGEIEWVQVSSSGRNLPPYDTWWRSFTSHKANRWSLSRFGQFGFHRVLEVWS